MGRSCSQIGKGRSVVNILTGRPIGKRPLGRLGVDGRIILECIL